MKMLWYWKVFFFFFFLRVSMLWFWQEEVEGVRGQGKDGAGPSRRGHICCRLEPHLSYMYRVIGEKQNNCRTSPSSCLQLRTYFLKTVDGSFAFTLPKSCIQIFHVAIWVAHCTMASLSCKDRSYIKVSVRMGFNLRKAPVESLYLWMMSGGGGGGTGRTTYTYSWCSQTLILTVDANSQKKNIPTKHLHLNKWVKVIF